MKKVKRLPYQADDLRRIDAARTINQEKEQRRQGNNGQQESKVNGGADGEF